MGVIESKEITQERICSQEVKVTCLMLDVSEHLNIIHLCSPRTGYESINPYIGKTKLAISFISRYVAALEIKTN